MKYIYIVLLSLSATLFSIEYNPQEWGERDIDGGKIYYKKKYEKIPTLCFHKIGDEERYALTSASFENFLIYLNDNNFYLLSDKEYITKDLSMVPTGFKPIVLGSDDASEGNFIYKTSGSSETGTILEVDVKPIIDETSMVGLLEKHIKPVDGKINFTFYISFNGFPFRQSGGLEVNDDYTGNLVVQRKFEYLDNHFIIGNHTFSHLITKDITSNELKTELDNYYKVMFSYLGDSAKEINTLAYPYGCHALSEDMEKMLKNYNYNGATIIGGFDFNGYFAKSPFNEAVNFYDISRIGVDNKNIKSIYRFLETVPLYSGERVFVVEKGTDLTRYNVSSTDIVEVIE